MCIEFAFGIDDAALSRGQLSAAMDNGAYGTQGAAFGGCRTHDVHAQLGRGVGAAYGHHGVHGAAYRAVQQRGVPASVHAAQRVVVL